MANPGTILYVDDEPVVSSYYLESLKRVAKQFKAQVSYHSIASAALAEASQLTKDDENRRSSIKAVVFDIMMPSEPNEDSKFSSKNTDDGVKMGIVLYHELRKIPSLLEIPMFALSNLMNEDILAGISNEDNLDIFSKFECPPSELAEKVRVKLLTGGGL